MFIISNGRANRTRSIVKRITTRKWNLKVFLQLFGRTLSYDNELRKCRSCLLTCPHLSRRTEKAHETLCMEGSTWISIWSSCIRKEVTLIFSIIMVKQCEFFNGFTQIQEQRIQVKIQETGWVHTNTSYRISTRMWAKIN